MNGDVYVFCGATNNYDILNSIEKLSNAAAAKNQVSAWRLISVDQDLLIPRWNPAVSMLN